MANIKISELNSLSKKASNDVLPIVDVSADETKKIKIEDLLDKNVSLIAVSDTAPAECSTGDKYFNTTTNLIYTAVDTDTWSETGEEPIEGIFYVVFNEQSSYAYNGTTLVSVGGGTEDIIISDEQPTTDDWKIWIDSGETENLGSEITNEYSDSERLAYSCAYSNPQSYELTLTKVHSANQYTAIKDKNIVSICGQFYVDSTTANTGNVIGSVPSDLIPNSNKSGTMVLRNLGNGSILGYGVAVITSTGDISMIPNISATGSQSPAYIVSITYTV